MKRRNLCKTVRWFLHLHYDVTTENIGLLRDGKVHLLLPNHPAYIEPPLLFSECWDVNLRPMCDEYLFRKPVSGWALRFVNAIMVPDLPATKADNREKSAEKARALTATALKSLAEGEDLVFYPSGHIKLTEKESIGNRRLAYEVCQGIFADREKFTDVRVIMLRTTGLDHSITSRLKTHLSLRRKVKLHFEDVTDRVQHWQLMERREFNEQLENWYNEK